MTDNNKKLSTSPQRIFYTVLGTGWFVIISVLIAFPLLAGLLASFRPGTELIRRGLSIDLNISTMTLSNYKYLFGGNADSIKYFTWYKNSLVITVASVVFTLFICYFVAYGLTMYNFKLRNLLFTLVIATMMVPFEILMLPLYKEIIAIKLVDTYVGVIITGLCSASTIFFFRQYLSGLPKDLLDAARIDGANEFKIFMSIIMPLIVPSSAMISLFVAVNAWNSWFDTYLYCSNKPSLHSLQYVLMSYLQASQNQSASAADAGSMAVAASSGAMTSMSTPISIRSSITVVATLPILVVYPFVQKYFVVGMTIGGVKE